MSSALKPVLPGAAATPAASPGKASGGAPAQQPPRAPALVGQNLTHHQPTAAHAAQSLAHVPMSPVSQNMAQMAQNMSHHGNLSHVGQNNGAPALGSSNGAPQPVKAVTGAPLSLVHDKTPPGVSQPLALTRPVDKKDEAEVTPAQSNGTVDSSKPLAADPLLHAIEKPKPEPSSSPAKLGEKVPTKLVENSPAKPSENSPAKPVGKTPANPTEKAAVPPIVPPKVDLNLPSDNQLQVNKLGSSTDAAEKASPAKPKDAKEPTPIAASVPSVSALTSEPKVPEESATAKTNNASPKPETPKPENKPVEADVKTPSKAEVPTEKKDIKPEADKPTETKTDQVDGPTPTESKPVKIDQKSPPKKEEQNPPPKSEEPKKEIPKEVISSPEPKKETPKAQQVTSTPPPKKAEVKTATAKSTLKLATVTPTARKRRQESKSPAKTPADGPSAAKKPAEADTPSTPDSRQKRNRTKVQPYQSPTPELAMATKLSASAGRSTPTKPGDDKLIVFYKNEYLAVRNAEGGFYVCRAAQNVFRTSRKIKIRWLSQDKALDPSGQTYKPDFYDITDMECVLTTLSMTRGSSGAQVLSEGEAARTRSILERAISAEQGGRPASLQLTEEHPDGLDLSLFTDESQLEKKKKASRKRNSSKGSLDKSAELEDAEKEDEVRPSPPKRAKATPKKSPKGAPKVAKSAPKTPISSTKRKSPAGSVAPNVVSKTAMATPTKASPAKPPAKKAKPTPAKKTPAKPAAAAKTATPAKPEPPAKTLTPRGKPPKKNDRESKIAALAATPSTSTGKTTRTPRKPPSKK